MNPDVTNGSNLPAPEQVATGSIAMPTGDTMSSPSLVHPGAAPAAAADNDRIEQEWVTKTKQVLLATRNDPYEQNRQLAALKADYMLKRYNKEVKLG